MTPRKSRSAGWVFPPISKTPEAVAVLHGDRVVMRVPLIGDIAAGRSMFIDLLTWERVKVFAGAEWTLKEGDKAAYVISTRKQARVWGEGEGGSTAPLVLARFIARAAPGTIVTYVNGDFLDLTNRNLVVRSRREHFEDHRVVPLASAA